MMENMYNRMVQNKRVLLSTLTGSRLYGLHHANSDWDHYAVVLDDVKSKHKVVGEEDVALHSLRTFTSQVARGVPQALEALWSPVAYVDPVWRPYLASLRPNYYEARYRHLSDQAVNVAPEKLRQKHSRLSLNMMSLAAYGWYNPVLEDWRLKLVLASRNSQELTDELRSMAQEVAPGDSAPLARAQRMASMV